MRRLLGMAGAVAAITYFFDANSGARRRAMLRDRTLAFFRRGARKSERAGRAVAAEAYGVTQKVQHLKEEDKGPIDDVTLTRKVETEIFREADVPKGQINVNAEHGVVYLRGEVESPDMISDLEKQARKVQGVSDVRNLLHTPGTPAPTA
jgi:osmotically-inducible protein OsmY